MPVEEGAPVIVAKVAEKFTVAKTNKPYIAGEKTAPTRCSPRA
jgi:hypothetical protein